MKNRDNGENDLIQKSLKGDAEAFSELTRRYRKKILGLCIHIIGDQELAEDVVQETFIRAFQGLDRFQMQSRFYTWLYRIAINLSINTLRKRSKHKNVYLTPDAADNIRFLQSSSESQTLLELEHQEIHEAIEKGMKELPSAQREVMQLFDIEGLSYSEIAKRLHVNSGTVRSRLHYARKRMRKFLAKIFNA